jgi:L-lactate permease
MEELRLSVLMVMAAGLPIVVVLVAMVWLRWSGTHAGMAGTIAAAAAGVILFGARQRDVAMLPRGSPAITTALQTTGASLGSVFALPKVLIACATAGLERREGEVMRVARKYCLPMTFLMGLLGRLANLVQ